MNPKLKLIIDSIRDELNATDHSLQSGLISTQKHLSVTNDLNSLLSSVTAVCELASKGSPEKAYEHTQKQPYPEPLKSNLLTAIKNLNSQPINFFYNDLLLIQIRNLPADLNLYNTCVELIKIYNNLIDYYKDVYDKGYKLDTDVNTKFKNKINALSALLKVDLSNPSNYQVIDSDNFEPLVVNLLIGKMPAEARIYLHETPVSHLYIRVSQFPRQAVSEKESYTKRVNEEFIREKSILASQANVDLQPLIVETQSEVKNTPTTSQINTQQQSKSSSVQNINQAEIQQISNLDNKATSIDEENQRAAAEDEFFSRLQSIFEVSLNKFASSLVNLQSKAANHKPDNSQVKIAELENYLQKSFNEIYQAISHLAESISTQSNQDCVKSIPDNNELITRFEAVVNNNLNQLLNNQLLEIDSKVDHIDKLSEKFTEGLVVFKQFTDNLKSEFINTLNKHFDSNKISKAILDLNAENYNNLIEELKNYNTNVSDYINNFNQKADNISISINKNLEDFLKTNTESFKDSFKSIKDEVTDFTNKLQKFEGYLNDTLISKLNEYQTTNSDLSKNIKVTNTYLTKTKTKSNYILYILISFNIILSVASFFKPMPSKDSKTLQSIYNNINNLDAKNKEAVMQLLGVSSNDLN